MCLSSTAVQTAMSHFPAVFFPRVVPPVFHHPTLAVIFCVFCLYLFRPARDFAVLITIPRAWLLQRKDFAVICAYTSEMVQENLWRLCWGRELIFPGDWEITITVSLTPAASKGGKGRDRVTATAVISRKAITCCFFRSKWSTPSCMFNGMVICIPAIVNDCGGYLFIASVFSKLIGGFPVFTVEHTVKDEVFKYFR